MTKVKGHADEEMVQVGQVPELDRLGNNAADEAADFGRRRVDPPVTDARRDCLVFVGGGIPLFCIRIASSLPSLVRWSIMMILWALPRILSFGLLVLCPKRRWIVHAVRDRAMPPGPALIWASDWVSLFPSAVPVLDVKA